tara:strand:- start:11 stop:841 length:831 start_codon:yes stop_codon:yes gene_type:complete
MIGGGLGASGIFNGITGSSDTTTNTNSVITPNSTGASRYVGVSDDAALSFVTGEDDDNLDAPFTMSCWVKDLWAGASSRGSLWSKGNTSAGTMEYRLFAGENRIYIDLVEGTASGSSNYNRTYWQANENSFPVNETGWIHLVFTYSGVTGSAVKIYRDSVYYAHHSNTDHTFGGMEDMSGELQFGIMQGGTTYGLNGNLCQVVFWNSWVATQQDVDYLYAGGAKHRDPLQGAQNYGGANYVVGWWPFDADLNDHSGNGNNGTAAGVGTVLEADVPF